MPDWIDPEASIKIIQKRTTNMDGIANSWKKLPAKKKNKNQKI